MNTDSAPSEFKELERAQEELTLLRKQVADMTARDAKLGAQNYRVRCVLKKVLLGLECDEDTAEAKVEDICGTSEEQHG